MITVKDFAEQHNISTSQVKKLIATGHIKAVKQGKTWLIEPRQTPPAPKEQRGPAPREGIEQYTIKPHILAWMIEEAEDGNPVWQERLELMRVNPHYSETVAKEPWFQNENGPCNCPYKRSCHVPRQWLESERQNKEVAPLESCYFYPLLKEMYERKEKAPSE